MTASGLRSAHMPENSGSRRAGRGRPALLSQDEILDAVIACGLDRFTVAEVAGRLGVRKSTLYNYVESRDRLYTLACARVFAGLDTTIDTPSWTDYLVELNLRIATQAATHPGLAAYLVAGRYEQSTLDVFARGAAELRMLLPDTDDDTLYTVAGQVTTATMSLLAGQPPSDPAQVESLRPIVRQFVDGAARMLESGSVLAHSWRDFQSSTLIRPHRAASAAGRSGPTSIDLALIRLDVGLTQREVADRMGIDQTRVSRLEHDPDPSLGAALEYLSALGVSPRLTITIGDATRTLAPEAPKHGDH